MKYYSNSLAKLPTARNLYKLKRAQQIIDKAHLDSELTPEICLAHAKLMKFLLKDDVSKRIDKTFGANRALRYYRKRYGKEGVTEVVKRYIKSRPFISSLLNKLVAISD